MSLAVEKQRRAAAQIVMMKMDVKPQETVKARTVSNTWSPPHAYKRVTYTNKHSFLLYTPCCMVVGQNKEP